MIPIVSVALGANARPAVIATIVSVTMTEVNEETTAPVVEDPKLTKAAADKALQLLSGETDPDLKLRLSVSPGGCSGLRQALSFSSLDMEGDHYFEQENGLIFVVDRMSYPYLIGATIDFVDQIDKQGFTVDLPYSEGTCACGDSFH